MDIVAPLAHCRIPADKIKVRCTQCGEIFYPNPDGCPECRLLDILVENDRPSPDRIAGSLVDRGIF